MSVRKAFNHSGDNGEGVPPVHIPNTEVKTLCAESTWLETAWEDRALPDPMERDTKVSLFFVVKVFPFF